MKDFFIYLDIDGVLNNYDWIKLFSDENSNFAKKNDKYIDLRCIKALNNLMKTLKDNGYNLVVIISSAWRVDMPDTIERLLKSGLNKPKFFGKTVFDKDRHRGKEIFEHTSSFGLNENEFVIIDDEVISIKEYFNEKNIIKTSGIFNFGLTQENVDIFLKQFLKNDINFEK